MILTNIDVTFDTLTATSFGQPEPFPVSATGYITVRLTSGADYQRLQSLLGRNIQLVEVTSAYSIRTYATGQYKERMLTDSKPQPIKTRTITSAIKELEINE
jgi:hypothetical protein